MTPASHELSGLHPRLIAPPSAQYPHVAFDLPCFLWWHFCLLTSTAMPCVHKSPIHPSRYSSSFEVPCISLPTMLFVKLAAVFVVCAPTVTAIHRQASVPWLAAPVLDVRAPVPKLLATRTQVEARDITVAARQATCPPCVHLRGTLTSLSHALSVNRSQVAGARARPRASAADTASTRALIRTCAFSSRVRVRR